MACGISGRRSLRLDGAGSVVEAGRRERHFVPPSVLVRLSPSASKTDASLNLNRSSARESESDAPASDRAESGVVALPLDRELVVQRPVVCSRR